MFGNAYKGRRVLVTGHTGFKGSWLVAWLLEMGATVGGYSIGVPSEPAHFDVLGLDQRLTHSLGDIRDRARLSQVVKDFAPDVVFHLAAQPLVRRSYAEPLQTFEVNMLGMLNLLDILRDAPAVKAAVLITSDKAYRNVEWVWGYRESDEMGGEDPYSGSKGCAELIFRSYYASFFRSGVGVPAIATARAGNVIGGGDWAEDRIVPDCVRAWARGEAVQLRNPTSTRPWQHVLEPLSGYLALGAALLARAKCFSGESYNFGPDASVDAPVSTLISGLGTGWPAAKFTLNAESLATRPESRLLKLSCDKALADLAWRPTLTFAETVRMTADWYHTYLRDGAADAARQTVSQIQEYHRLAASRSLPWAAP